MRGELFELGFEDLAFTRREAHTAVQAVGGSLTDAEITAVFEETEGWPPRSSSPPRAVAPLQAECLAALTPEQRAMLRRTSILERVDRELCDAVLGYPPGERELQSIDDLGAFLVRSTVDAAGSAITGCCAPRSATNSRAKNRKACRCSTAGPPTGSRRRAMWNAQWSTPTPPVTSPASCGSSRRARSRPTTAGATRGRALDRAH